MNPAPRSAELSDSVVVMATTESDKSEEGGLRS